MALVIALAVGALIVAGLTAFLTIGDRSADLWLLDLLHYAARPRRLVWRSALPATADGTSAAWAETPLALAWRSARPAAATTPTAAD
jgi:hypothetical protein